MASITIEIKRGIVLRSSMDVLDLALELTMLIPECYDRERQELESRVIGLSEIMKAELQKVLDKQSEETP